MSYGALAYQQKCVAYRRLILIEDVNTWKTIEVHVADLTSRIHRNKKAVYNGGTFS